MTIRVSDHALIRWIERAGGMDVERLRSSLERSLARAQLAAETIGQTEYSIRADGLIYQVRNGIVTTIMTDKGGP